MLEDWSVGGLECWSVGALECWRIRICLGSHGPKEFGRFHSVARSGQESIAEGLYVFSVVLCGPKGQESVAQGLPHRH